MQQIIQPFCDEYERGRTPNPCVRCNPIIKFGSLMEEAVKLGADYLATGHYAGIFCDAGGHHLIRAEDTLKDQSYMLYALNQSQLSHVFFPLESLTKKRVREIAREAGIPSADQKGSQDACFVGGDYRKFINNHVVFKPGPMVNSRGQILGQHRGLPFYTIGQRHGLGIALKQPAFIISLSYAKNQVVVGTAEELNCSQLMVSGLSWVSRQVPLESAGITAKIRYKSAEVRATMSIEESRTKVILAQPQRAVTPGQAIVFYSGKEVLGGGTIEEKM
jgi:tRNA-specific 2-thiouridylase